MQARCRALCKFTRVQLQLDIHPYYLRLGAYKLPDDCRRTRLAPDVRFRTALRMLVVCKYFFDIVERRIDWYDETLKIIVTKLQGRRLGVKTL
jgi:hypothetical protein